MKGKKPSTSRVVLIASITLLSACWAIHAYGSEWERSLGGIDSDGGLSVQQTTDRGYIIVGSTFSFGAGGEDVYLIKTDAEGDETWSQTFGGSVEDGGASVQQTFDGGYIITGRTYSFGAGDGDVYLIKTDSGGNEVWSTTFGGTDRDCGHSVEQTSDGATSSQIYSFFWC